MTRSPWYATSRDMIGRPRRPVQTRLEAGKDSDQIGEFNRSGQLHPTGVFVTQATSQKPEQGLTASLQPAIGARRRIGQGNRLPKFKRPAAGWRLGSYRQAGGRL